MPTFSAIQLDRYLEPGTNNVTAMTPSLNQDNVKKVRKASVPVPKLERRRTTSFQFDDRDRSYSRNSVDIPPPYPSLRRHNSVSVTPQVNGNSNGAVRLQISPALYTTPESTPIPVSPTSSFPPSSPFLINHKRRGPRLAKSFSEVNVASVATSGEDVMVDELERSRSLSEEKVPLKGNDNVFNMIIDEENVDIVEEVNIGVSVGSVEASENKAVSGTSGEREGGESEDFYDPQESMCFSSSVDNEDFCGERSFKTGTPLREFYDAWEELSSDNGPQSAQRSLSDVETDLREMRLTLLMEIEKRKQGEEVVHSMKMQWQMLREKMQGVGVVLPADLAVLEDNESGESPTKDICRQIHLARFVSESVGRGITRAEVEAEMEAQLEMKNFEIARLGDRLHYYETMNREMSQRNQEAVGEFYFLLAWSTHIPIVLAVGICVDQSLYSNCDGMRICHCHLAVYLYSSMVSPMAPFPVLM